MPDDSFERALQQLSKALTVGYAVAVKLRKEAADAEQHAILIEQAFWSATSAIKKLGTSTK